MERIYSFFKNRLLKEEKIYLVACLLLVPLMLFNVNNVTISFLCKIFGVLSMAFLIYGLYIWYKKNNTFNSPGIYFVLASYLCWYGQVIIRCFGLIDDVLIQIDVFDPTMFYKTLVFLTLSFNLMFLGIIIFSKKRNLNVKIKDEKIKNINLKKSMTFVAITMIVVGGIMHYYDLFNNLYQSLRFGYTSLYDGNTSSALYNILSNTKMFFWPGAIILCLANKENKKLFYIILGVAIFDLALCFLTGARSDALMILIAFFWIFTSEFKTINLKQIIFFALAALILMKVIVVVYDFRIMSDKSFLGILNLIFHPKTNMFAHILNEFGFNIFSLYHTMLLVPTVDNFGYGYTYFASVMAMIPSLFMGGYSFSDKAALPNWLMERLNMDYGPGYTIVAESFYNFGYFGFIAMFLIGGLIGFVFNNDNKGDKRILKAAIISILLYSNIFIIRDTFLMVFRKFLYLIILPFAAIFVLKFILDKGYNHKLFKTLYKVVDFVQNFINKLISRNKNTSNKRVLISIQNNEKNIDFINNHIVDLKNKGYEVDVAINQKDIKIIADKIINLSSNNKNNFIQFLNNQKELKKLIKRNEYFLIESYGYKSWLTTRLRSALTNKKNTQNIYINLDNEFTNKSKLQQIFICAIEKYLSLFTDKIFIKNKNYYNKLNSIVHCDIVNLKEDNINFDVIER